MAKLDLDTLPNVSIVRKYFMGIDPGGSGGICIIDQDGAIFEAFKTPDTPEELIARLKRYRGRNIRCFVEQVYCRPTDGVKAAFGFGRTVGTLYTALAAAQIPFEEINPKIWQKGAIVTIPKEAKNDHKNRLKARAQELFPDFKVTLWSADAILIADHCYRFFKSI